MSAPASSQGPVIRWKYHRIRPDLTAIDVGISSGETYSLMTDSEAEFWT
jgi:hypothetical protein